MKDINNAKEYWESLHEIDRANLLESIYIDKELSKLDFYNLPNHIRFILYAIFNTKWKDLKYELSL
jgi:hypothetical protein